MEEEEARGELVLFRLGLMSPMMISLFWPRFPRVLLSPIFLLRRRSCSSSGSRDVVHRPHAPTLAAAPTAARCVPTARPLHSAPSGHGSTVQANRRVPATFWPRTITCYRPRPGPRPRAPHTRLYSPVHERAIFPRERVDAFPYVSTYLPGLPIVLPFSDAATLPSLSTPTPYRRTRPGLRCIALPAS
ncbi:hypothetical protein AcV5_005364 [Taiwanofungus camphoratus]|nr:hypothetical protein AcV5_005364 [Antrodia cinnamomea]